MSYKKQILYTILIGILFLGCFQGKEKKAIKDKEENKLTNKEAFFFKILMENDTLSTNKEKGKIKFFFKLNDSIKVVKEDKRRIHVVLGLMPHDDNKTKFEPNGKFIKELNFSPINSNDTIQIPFSLLPNFKGKGIIVSIITDGYTLHSYYKEKVRMLSYEQMFEKEVYIK